MRVRTPAVAGRFYDADPVHLWSNVDDYLRRATLATHGEVRALIAPHAGYIYSGPIAGSAFATLTTQAASIERVVLLGTCHTAGVAGVVASSADAFETPLGLVPVDRAATSKALDVPGVYEDDAVHRFDHALEVELPFLQRVLGRFAIVPLLVGREAASVVASVLEQLDGPGTLIVLSTDLSHYHSYEEAQTLDNAAAAAIQDLAPDRLDAAHACGVDAVRGLLEHARRKNWRAQLLDLRSSGDTAGSRDRVVGYAAVAFIEPRGSA